MKVERKESIYYVTNALICPIQASPFAHIALIPRAARQRLGGGAIGRHADGCRRIRDASGIDRRTLHFWGLGKISLTRQTCLGTPISMSTATVGVAIPAIKPAAASGLFLLVNATSGNRVDTRESPIVHPSETL